MLKFSSGLGTNARTANRDHCNPDSGHCIPIESRNVARILQSLGENQVFIHDSPDSMSCIYREVSIALPSPPPTRPELVQVEIENLLRRSGPATQQVRCDVDDTAVILSGNVRRYHHLQIVLQIVMRYRDGREIVNKIGVTSNIPT